MSDQLSKVVHCQVCGESEPFSGACGSSDPRALCKSGRVESAAAPVEVEAVAWFIDDGVAKSFTTCRARAADWSGEPGYTITPLVPAETVATLARQLAEAKAVLVSLLTEREHRTDGDLPTLADRCRHLSRGDRDVIQMRGSLIETYKTRAEQAESTLATTTRRVAEGELARKVEHGVQPMKGGKAWGVLYADGHSTSYGWGDPATMPLHDPKFCKAATDVTYRGSPHRRELETAELVAVTRTTVVTRREPSHGNG